MRGVCVALVVAVRSLQASKGDPRRDDMCTWGRSTADLLEVAALRATAGDAGEPARVGGIPGEGDGLNSDARLRVAGLGTAGYCDDTGCLDMNLCRAAQVRTSAGSTVPSAASPKELVRSMLLASAHRVL